MVRSFTENVAKLPGEVGVGPKQNWQTAAENFPSGENHPATASRRVTEGSGEAANSAATPSTAAESRAETRAGSRRRPAGPGRRVRTTQLRTGCSPRLSAQSWRQKQRPYRRSSMGRNGPQQTCNVNGNIKRCCSGRRGKREEKWKSKHTGKSKSMLTVENVL